MEFSQNIEQMPYDLAVLLMGVYTNDFTPSASGRNTCTLASTPSPQRLGSVHTCHCRQHCSKCALTLPKRPAVVTQWQDYSLLSQEIHFSLLFCGKQCRGRNSGSTSLKYWKEPWGLERWLGEEIVPFLDIKTRGWNPGPHRKNWAWWYASVIAHWKEETGKFEDLLTSQSSQLGSFRCSGQPCQNIRWRENDTPGWPPASTSAWADLCTSIHTAFSPCTQAIHDYTSL